MAIVFLLMEDICHIHANQLACYGGSDGQREPGLLASAIAQPQATFDGEYLHKFPFEMAAAYLFHIVQNHPFIDGNKRTGAAAALAFLDFNEIEIEPPSGAIYDITMAVATGQAGKGQVAEFFRGVSH